MQAIHFAVSAVRYEAGGVCVQRVHFHEVRRGSIGPPLEIGRDQLLGALESGRVVVTIRRALDGTYAADGIVRLIGIRARQYLRCDDVAAPSDDLAGLPNF